MAILGAARPHRVSSQYLHRPNGRPRTVASPGDPGPSRWPGDFPAGPLPGSAPPARGWTGRCVWLGGLRQGCRLCFRHLQKNPAVGRARPPSRRAFIRAECRSRPGVALRPAPPPLESLSAHPPQVAPARDGPGPPPGTPLPAREPALQHLRTPNDAPPQPWTPPRGRLWSVGRRQVGCAAAALEVSAPPCLFRLGTLALAPKTHPTKGLRDEAHAAQPRSTEPVTTDAPEVLCCCVTSSWLQTAGYLLPHPRSPPCKGLITHHASGTTQA